MLRGSQERIRSLAPAKPHFVRRGAARRDATADPGRSARAPQRRSARTDWRGVARLADATADPARPARARDWRCARAVRRGGARSLDAPPGTLTQWRAARSRRPFRRGVQIFGVVFDYVHTAVP